MARIMYFQNDNASGIIIYGLPMPDNSKRAYGAIGKKQAFKTILELWRNECAAMNKEYQHKEEKSCVTA